MNTDQNFLQGLSNGYSGRLERWQNFYKSYLQMEEEASHADPSDGSLGRITTMNLPQYEKTLVDMIENKLGSNLFNLILQREKVKILCNGYAFPIIHQKVKQEIKRLRKYVSKDDIQLYIKLCVVPNKVVKHLIEVVLDSNLKTLLLHQMKFLNTDKEKFEFYNNMATNEWTSLATEILEQDVVVYAVNTLRKEGF